MFSSSTCNCTTILWYSFGNIIYQHINKFMKSSGDFCRTPQPLFRHTKSDTGQIPIWIILSASRLGWIAKYLPPAAITSRVIWIAKQFRFNIYLWQFIENVAIPILHTSVQSAGIVWSPFIILLKYDAALCSFDAFKLKGGKLQRLHCWWFKC